MVKQNYGSQNQSQDRNTSAQGGGPTPQHPGHATPILAVAALFAPPMAPILGPGGHAPPMFYDSCPVQQGVRANVARDMIPLLNGMPQAYSPSSNIPVLLAGGPKTNSGMEAYMAQVPEQYARHSLHQRQLPHGFGRGGPIAKGRGRGGLSGHNGRKGSLGLHRGGYNGDMSRQAPPSHQPIVHPIPPLLHRRDSSSRQEVHTPTTPAHGIERFPDYIDIGYDVGANSSIKEMCFKKTIGADVEDMTTLWVGNIPKGTTAEDLREFIAAQVPVNKIGDVQFEDRVVAWTFVQ